MPRAAAAKVRAVAGGLCLLLAGCAASTLELTAQGAAVQVAEGPLEVRPCTRLGRVQGDARSVINDVEEQRLVSARNRAAELGGNWIVSAEVTVLGSRNFDVYLCPAGAVPASAAPAPAMPK